MKKIEAIIRPEKLSTVKDKLEKIGCSGLTITEVHGYGKQGGIEQQWRGEKYKVEFIPKVKLEIICADTNLENICEVIISSAKTGEVGDGKIFISNIENTIRVRTGERGEKAL